MKVFQEKLHSLSDLEAASLPDELDLILLFFSIEFDGIEDLIIQLRNKYPKATISGCSTSGEILGETVSDRTVSFTGIQFDSTKVKITSEALIPDESAQVIGLVLSNRLQAPDLKHVFVFSIGLNINGSELVEGLKSKLPDTIHISGGLAGDNSNFEQTFVIANDQVHDDHVVAVGLYGESLKVGIGSRAGYDSFGLERLVTRSEGNVLYELDGKPALELYKTFIGKDQASQLPSSGIRFPLSMRDVKSDFPVYRSIMRVNEEEQSVEFAGDIFQGSYVRLMRGNADRIISGAEEAATNAKETLNESAELAILISCMARRVSLGQIVEEEVEAVREVLGPKPAIAGFYSYGEIAPVAYEKTCRLHNQTMTITTLSE